jgi:hypothetical protein
MAVRIVRLGTEYSDLVLRVPPKYRGVLAVGIGRLNDEPAHFGNERAGIAAKTGNYGW